MKRTAIIISAILAGAMAVPTAAAAKNNYPTFPPVLSYEEKEALTDEEKAERDAQYKAAQDELVRAFKNGEYDLDFNLDGEVNSIDAQCILVRTSEFATSSERNYLSAYYFDKYDTKHYFRFTPQMRANVDENGDINNDGYINFVDSSILLVLLTNAKEKGDVNTDGMVDAKDASDLLTYYSAISTGKDINSVFHDNMVMFGDLNDDGIIDASDASYVLAEYSKRATE